MCFAPQRRALFRDLNFQKWSEPLVFLTVWLPNVLRATTACTFSRSELPKVVRTGSVFNSLTSKCASRHNGVHFFDISTSKSAPKLRCFVHFDLAMCFAPQRRALFRHLNFQKWSGAGVFCTFWLRNVLRATTACNFSSLIWPAGSAPAALASLLFDPPEPQIIGKTQCFATFRPFPASASSFFLYSFSSTLLSSNLSLLSASSLLCFSSVHIVGSVTSKLPSILNINKHLNNALKCKKCENMPKSQGLQQRQNDMHHHASNETSRTDASNWLSSNLVPAVLLLQEHCMLMFWFCGPCCLFPVTFLSATR